MRTSAELEYGCPSVSPDRFRAAYFPHLETAVYLAACSLGARSAALDRAMTQMLASMDRDQLAWAAFEDQVRQVRSNLARLIGANVEQIALVPNASIGAYQVVSTLRFDERRTILYADGEFPSIAHVWLAQRPRGALPRCIRVDGGHTDMEAQYAAYIDGGTKFVSIPHTCYLDGKTLPVNRIAAHARRYGAKVFVDAYQALGVQPIDVNELDCDYLVGGTMKYLLGLPGLAFLFVRNASGNDLEPQLTGWFGRKRPFAFDATSLDFPDTAARYETGTPAVPAIFAANAGLGLIASLDLHSVREHVASLTEYAAQHLLAQGETLLRVPIRGTHGAHLSLCDPSPARTDAHLQAHHITVSPRGNALRLAFHYYNNTSDVDRFCRALRAYRK